MHIGFVLVAFGASDEQFSCTTAQFGDDGGMQFKWRGEVCERQLCWTHQISLTAHYFTPTNLWPIFSLGPAVTCLSFFKPFPVFSHQLSDRSPCTGWKFSTKDVKVLIAAPISPSQESLKDSSQRSGYDLADMESSSLTCCWTQK